MDEIPEALLASLLLASVRDEAIVALDATGRIASWNPGAERMTGYSVGEARGRHIALLYPDEEVQLGAPGRELRRAEGDGSSESEGWQVRRDGSRLWASVTTTALRDESGGLLGFSRVVRDLTERLRTEEALRVSQAKFSGIVSIASEAIVSVDEEQRIVLFNQGAEQIFGYVAREVFGEPLDVLLPPRFHDIHREHIARFARSGIPARRIGHRQEIYGRRKSGEEFPAEASISQLEVRGERWFTAVLRDISERKAAEREIRELLVREQSAREAAERAAAARDEVLRVVAHDLGNSLSAILVTTSVLLRTLPEEQRSGEAGGRIDSIRELAGGMQRLRSDLLDVASIEAGRLSLECTSVSPEALLDTARDGLAPLAAERDLCLEVEVAPELPLVRADRERVLQVLGNLGSNAIKFTPAGGHVVLSSEPVPEGVRFRVADSGVGITPEELPRVWDRFWKRGTADGSGTGLGLAIARGIVEAHEGTIEVESREGEGSVFSFTIPSVTPNS
ncbi:MAG: PAS domain-containing sensor histidine kinase [Longimicrobiaceae bacterium]